MRSSDSRMVTVLPGGSPETRHLGAEVLPPLTSQFPQWSRAGRLGLYPTPPPGLLANEKLDRKVSKKGVELAAVGRSEGLVVAPPSDPLLRVTQLEQNIRFLQEQHQLMLTSLHQEVETLRQRNRDLQFQLVFTKGGVSLVQSSPSSPEDDSKPKIVLSPKQLNVTPLQVEILEKDVAELKAALGEARTRSAYLSAIVDEQKKKLDSYETGRQELEAVGSRMKPASRSDAQIQAGGEADVAELAVKLEEAEQVIRRLRRDNDEHRRELATIRANLSKGLGGGRQLGRGGGRNQQAGSTQRFPPLLSQSYWHHGQQPRPGMEFVSHRHCTNGASGSGGGSGGGAARLEKEAPLVGRPAPSLPNLRGTTPTGNYGGFSNGNNSNGHRRYNGNGNHYYRGSKEEGGEGRKFRGGGRGNRDSKQ